MKETYVKPEVMTIEFMTEQAVFSTSNSPYLEPGSDF